MDALKTTNRRREKSAEIPAVSSGALLPSWRDCVQPSTFLLCCDTHLKSPFLALFSSLYLLGHLPHSCQEVRSTNALVTDGEHLLNIQGTALQVRQGVGLPLKSTKADPAVFIFSGTRNDFEGISSSTEDHF